MKNIMKKLTLTSMVASTMLFAGGDLIPPPLPIAADPNPIYLGLGVLWAGYSADDCCGVTPQGYEEGHYGFIGRAGYDFNEYVGIEVRGLVATLDSNLAETTHYGIFLKPQYPVSERVNIYGLLGYGRTEIDLDCTTLDRLSRTHSESGFSWGIGLEYDFSGNESDRLEGDYDRPFDGYADQETAWGMWIDYQNLLYGAHGSNLEDLNIDSNIVSIGITYDF
ncbi:MAG: outer membrane beta-barrel protein [Sulfurovum sp.]|nr:outer membrane beta-barrel protein [Sulfurovum sp.]